MFVLFTLVVLLASAGRAVAAPTNLTVRSVEIRIEACGAATVGSHLFVLPMDLHRFTRPCRQARYLSTST